jgi:hypothetical protein
MHPKQLIGQKALRTKPVTYAHGTIDRSYTSGEPLLILDVTDDHIVYEYSLFRNETRIGTLPYEWIDNNWTSYDELINRALRNQAIFESVKNRTRIVRNRNR